MRLDKVPRIPLLAAVVDSAVAAGFIVWDHPCRGAPARSTLYWGDRVSRQAWRAGSRPHEPAPLRSFMTSIPGIG